MLCCVVSAGKEVDPKSLHIGRLRRRGRVSLFDWLYEYEEQSQGRGELQELALSLRLLGGVRSGSEGRGSGGG